MSSISCPHCSVENPVDSRFCESCGKAMPDAVAGGPRVVGEGAIASTAAGQSLQGEELQKQMKSARGALLAVGILQLIGAVIFYFILSSAMDDPRMQVDENMVLLVPLVMVLIGGVYFGLWFWAKSSPFPAALVGLILFGTLWLVDILADPAGFYRGILIKVIIIAVLIKAVKAGAEYRKLKRAAEASR